MSVITVAKPDLEGYVVLTKPLSGGQHHYCTNCGSTSSLPT